MHNVEAGPNFTYKRSLWQVEVHSIIMYQITVRRCAPLPRFCLGRELTARSNLLNVISNNSRAMRMAEFKMTPVGPMTMVQIVYTSDLEKVFDVSGRLRLPNKPGGCT